MAFKEWRENVSARQNLTKEEINTLRKNQREAGLVRSRMSSESNGFTIILSIVFIFAIFMMLVRILINPNAPIFSLEYFLNTLSNAPSIDISWITKVSAQNLDAPSWVKNILSIITTPLSFMLWFSTGIAQLCVYIFYILRFFFGLA